MVVRWFDRELWDNEDRMEWRERTVSDFRTIGFNSHIVLWRCISAYLV